MEGPAEPRGAFFIEGMWGIDMLQTLNSRRLILATAVATLIGMGAGTASAAVAVRTFTINTADIVDLYSGTFDPALTPCVAPATQECTFFGGTLPATRQIVITPTGTGSGTLNVNYDTISGEILQVNSLVINLPTLSLLVTQLVPPNVATISVIPGNNVPTTSPQDVPFVESGTGTLGRDLDGAGFNLMLGAGTADPDQAPAIGQAAVFQHNDSPLVDAPDFAVFAEIVDTCTGSPSLCGLITSGLLTLDAIKYRLEGTIGCKPAGSSLILKAQTVNNSIYRVNLTTTTADTDCDLDGDSQRCGQLPRRGQCGPGGHRRRPAWQRLRQLPAWWRTTPGPRPSATPTRDAFGNRCDGDLNNNNFTNASGQHTVSRPQLGQPSIAPVYQQGGHQLQRLRERAGQHAVQVACLVRRQARARARKGPGSRDGSISSRLGEQSPSRLSLFRTPDGPSRRADRTHRLILRG